MIKAYLTTEYTFELREGVRRSLQDNEIEVALRASALCGSDISLYGGRAKIPGDIILGHETAGEVSKIGESVTDLAVGDAVAIFPGRSCGECGECKNGFPNLCWQTTYHADYPTDGTLQEYFIVESQQAFKIPKSMSYETASLTEPTANVLAAFSRFKTSISNKRIAIGGAGPIGLIAVAIASYFGAKEILVTDLSQFRLGLAKQMGAQSVVDASSISSIDSFRNEFDYGIECAGSSSSLVDLTEIIVPRGEISLVGLMSDKAEFPWLNVQRKEIDIHGVFRFPNIFNEALELIERLKLEDIITHRYTLSEVREAFDFAFESKDNGKIIIVP